MLSLHDRLVSLNICARSLYFENTVQLAEILSDTIHLMRYIYSGATKTIQYVFISVGLAATVIRLAMMSYVLLRKFLLWRSGAKDQGLYSIFFWYFYPGK